MKERAPQAFNIEYEGRSTDQALYDDIVSYLGEYRLNVQKYNYRLLFDGNLRDVYTGDTLLHTAGKALLEKQNKGLPTHREEAEIEAIGSLDTQLRFVDNGTIVWVSPPGPKEEGFGDYEFMFIGYKKQYSQDVEMTAIRIEHPNLSQNNNALSEFIGKRVSFSNVDDILRSPVVVYGHIDEENVDAILRRNFSFTQDNSRDIFDRVIHYLEPSIREFIQHTKDKNISTQQKLQELHALEHYALELKERYKKAGGENISYMSDYRPYIPLDQLARVYKDKELPAVAGSCGASGEIESNNALAFNFKNLFKAIFGEDSKDYKDDPNLCRCQGLQPHFHCPGTKKLSDGKEMPCRNAIIVGDRTTSCPSCGMGQVC